MAFVPAYNNGVLNLGTRQNPETPLLSSPQNASGRAGSITNDYYADAAAASGKWASDTQVTAIGADYNTTTNHLYVRQSGTSNHGGFAYVYAQGTKVRLATIALTSGAGNAAFDAAWLTEGLVILTHDTTDDVYASTYVSPFAGHPAV